jgi:hypothetical protein
MPFKIKDGDATRAQPLQRNNQLSREHPTGRLLHRLTRPLTFNRGQLSKFGKRPGPTRKQEWWLALT